MASTIKTTFLVIGGGIAGVSCVETLQYLCPDEKIILLTESALIKTVTNLVPLGKALTRFDIEECDGKYTFKSNVEIIIDQLHIIDSKNKSITTLLNKIINYEFMCLCTGGRPKLIEQVNNTVCKPYVLGIRDTESVLEFQKRIKHSKRIAIVGNGGIASEIVYELHNISIDWIIKDKFISQTFVDPGAAEFFQNKINQNDVEQQLVVAESSEPSAKPSIKRMRYSEENHKNILTKNGAALGPDWHRLINLNVKEKNLPKTVTVHNNCEIKNIELNRSYSEKCDANDNNSFPLIVKLNNDTEIYCDFLISATGVVPAVNFQIINDTFNVADDNGILVNELMKTSIDYIYAAGDICTAGWQFATHWFQMRLWTQARQMGSMAGKSMSAAFNKISDNEIYQDFCFELFGHVTQLFGYQIVLLGKYNGQNLSNNYEVLIRMTKNKEYIKYVLVNGKLQGAILIGETGLEETTENLILNQLDLTPYGDDILNPDIDIEDYFD